MTNGWSPEKTDGLCFECLNKWKTYDETKNDGLVRWPDGNWYCRNCVPSELDDDYGPETGVDE